MEVLGFSFNAIAPVLFAVALGWLIAWRKDINERDIGVLNKLCFRYLLSLHIFNSTLSIDYYAEFNLKLLLFTAGSIFLTASLAWIIFTATIKEPARRCIFIVSAFRSNNIIYALPLAVNLFGESGTKAAAMLVPVTIILFNLFTVIAMVYHSHLLLSPEEASPLDGALKRTVLDIGKNPLIIGSVLGIVLSVCHIDLPLFLSNGIRSVALTGTPISLVLLGAQIDLRTLAHHIVPVFKACMLRLVIVPGIMLPLIIGLGFRGPELGALMVVFGAPCAVTNLVMARNYQMDPAFAAQTVYLSTVLSMLTMFGIISVLRVLGLF
ncbi:MAG: AEC family transporter [Treponema sp.]|jgi:predicted permease|nr:AEC family transporter [Treponema sp.]